MVVAICGCTYAAAQHFMHLPDKMINFFDGKRSIRIRYRRFSFSGAWPLRHLIASNRVLASWRGQQIEAMDDAHREAISRAIAMTGPGMLN
ncbi:hypothetical protein CI41S_20560 [Bradyrhizobium ivorense]|nr:hypothetical protein CI41S_20560 [Bradyrhizobium ivorense]